MTSVLANVRSHFPQPGMSNDTRYPYTDLPRSLASSASTLQHMSSSSSSSNPSTSTLALAAATPATSMSSGPSPSDAHSLNQPSVMAHSASTSDLSNLYAAGAVPASRAFDSALGGYVASSGVPDLAASCPPEGPSFTTTDFDADLAAAAFAPIFSSSVPDTTGLDASSVPLSFPVLPASLLDEAPEYEYSVHTRMNVFEASDYGADIPTFAFAEDGTPILDGAAEYNLWSTGLGVDAGDLSASSAFAYPEDELAFMDGNRLDTQPRTADFHVPQYTRLDGSLDAGSDSLLAPQGDLLVPNASGSSHIPSSSAIGMESTPSVLQAAPSASQMQQRQLQGQRLSLGGDDMYESQAGPSRGPFHRSRDALSASNSPYGRGRPMLQSARSFTNMGAAAGFSSPDVNAELRRLSTGGPTRGPSRDPVVPSQNVGRARMMSWQSGPAYPADQDWQSNFPDNGADAGFAGARGMPENGMGGMHPHGGMMPPSRSYSYGMQHSNSGFMPHHGMNPHATDMINALGDAMDARIDVDGIAKCPYPNCNKTFAKNRSYNLKAHLRSHSQLKPFACSVCPRAFSRKHDLERHSRVHSGDKPYVCEICGKGFPRSDALRRHWRVEKECGDKAAALEASQSLTGVLGGDYGDRSPEHQQGGASNGQYGMSFGGQQQQQQQQQQYGQMQQQGGMQQQMQRQQQQFAAQQQQYGGQQQRWADQQQQQQLRRA